MSSPAPHRYFRQARRASPGWNLAKTAAQTAVFWTVFLIVLPAAILAVERQLGVPGFSSPAGGVAGWALLILASALGLSSGYTMASAGRGTPLPIDCPRRLVVKGPYAYVRNPMAIAGLAQGAAVGLLVGSVGVLAYVLVGGLLWNTLVRPIEEEHLQELFGDEFDRYRVDVACWLPRRTPYSDSGR